jgi:regulator of sigma E protease
MFGDIIANVKDVIMLVILFGFAILVHEMGHFLVARWCGLVIDVFSIGFGPAIWKKKVNGVTYKVAWIPFGGYVALPQLDPSSMAIVQGGNASPDAEKKPDENNEEHRNLPPIAPWQKIVVSVAGAAGNIVLAIIIAWVIYLSPNAGTSEGGPLIMSVTPECQAFERGLRTGDEIVAVNDKKVATWYDYHLECLLSDTKTQQVKLTIKSGKAVKDVIVPTTRTEIGATTVKGVGKFTPCAIKAIVLGASAHEAGMQIDDIVKKFDGIPINSPEQFTDLVYEHDEVPAPIVVERQGKLVSLSVTPRLNKEYNVKMIGVKVGMPGHDIPWMQYKKPMDQLNYDASSIRRLLKALVTPREFHQAVGGLGGVVSIVATLWVAIKISILNGLGFLRFLCVNLALINMLPIPVLDGGHVMFSLWEIVTRRRVNPKVANVLVNVFASLLIAAVLFLTYRDIVRLPKIFKMGRNREDKAGLSTNSAQPGTATGSVSTATGDPGKQRLPSGD